MPLKVALIGTGNIAHKHYLALSENSEAGICGVYDIDLETGRRFAEKYHLNQFASLEESIQNTDIISVCTPHHLHAPIIKKVLKAGKICISEKPLCLHKSELRGIKANWAGRLYMITQNRFNMAVQTVRKALVEGKLGKILYCAGATRWYRPFEYYQHSWKGIKNKEGGILYNQGIHLLDLCHWLPDLNINESKVVFANKQLLDLGYCIETENFMSVMLQNHSIPINLEFSTCVSNRNLENTLLIVGEKGTIKIGGPGLNKIEYSSIFLDGNDETEPDKNDIYGLGHRHNYTAVLKSIIYGSIGSEVCGYQQAVDLTAKIEDIYSFCNKNAKQK